MTIHRALRVDIAAAETCFAQYAADELIDKIYASTLRDLLEEAFQAGFIAGQVYEQDRDADA